MGLDYKKIALIDVISLIKKLDVVDTKKIEIIQKVLKIAGELDDFMEAKGLLKLSEVMLQEYFKPTSMIDKTIYFDFIKHPADSRYHLAMSSKGVYVIESPEEGDKFNYQMCQKANKDESALYYLCTEGHKSKEAAQKICDKFNLELSSVFQDDDGNDRWTVAQLISYTNNI